MLGFYDTRIAAAGCCSFLFGYALSMFNTAWNHYSLLFGFCEHGARCEAENNRQMYMQVAIMMSAMVGAFFSSVCVKRGRVFGIKIALAMHVAGSFLLLFSQYVVIMVMARIVQGIGVGCLTVTVPMYISEMCPIEKRGTRGAVFQFSITIGILVGIVLGVGLESIPDDHAVHHLSTASKVMMYGILVLPGLVGSVMFILLSTVLSEEPPEFLVYRGKLLEAEKVLAKILGPPKARERMAGLLDGESDSVSAVLPQEEMSLGKAFGDREYRWALAVGCVLSLFQQFSGINVMVGMSNDLFASAGLDQVFSTYASIAMASLNVGMTFFCLFVDKFGRRPLYLIGSLGQAMSLGGVVITGLLRARFLPIISAVGATAFVAFFAIGQGPVTWIFLNEIYPLNIKCKATTLASGLNWVASALVNVFATKLSEPHFLLLKFALFSGSCFFVFFFALFAMKETKDIQFSPYIKPQKTRKTSKEWERRPLLWGE
eukprot:Polyplicarium_translucidae@DN2404_c0_g1_i1.p1